MLRREMTRVTRYRYLLAIAATLLALVCVEVLCRFFIPAPASLRFQQDIDELEGMQLHAATGIIENDPELFWRLAPDKRLPDNAWPFFGIVSNGQSLREDHDIPLAKPDGEIRILFLGDSCTYGYGVAHDRTFAAVAESLLREQGVAGYVECINAGVPGYTLFQGYRYLATQGLRYQPDLVVLNFGWNDYGMWDDLSDAEHYALLQAMQPPPPLRRSHLFRLIWSRTRTRPAPRSPHEKRPRLLPGEFAETLENLHALPHERRIPILILVWPMRDNIGDTPSGLRSQLQMEMIAFGQAHPLLTSPHVSGVLDLIPLGRALVEEHGFAAVYFDHGHVTPLAHQAIAASIIDHLGPWLEK
jgi:lysophospholipase L1-like esterase